VLSDGAYDYLYGPGDTPVEEINLATSTPTFLTYTPADSTWLTTNAAGDETGFYGYDAFGNLAFGTPTTAFGYAGQYIDSDSGFSNLRARFYDPENGSFTTRDQDFATTDTAYTYAGGDPVNGNDPFGEWPSWASAWHALASGYDGFRHVTASLVDLPPSLVMATGEAIYNAYDQIYQDGANGCSFFSLGVQEDVLGAVLADESAGLMFSGEGEAELVALPESSLPSSVEAQEIVETAKPVGSALKTDAYHSAAANATGTISANGSVYRIVGGDGIERLLVQAPGEEDGVAGRYEWIVNDDGELMHQFFVKGGSINGKPMTP
jgi:RHS repeat-associated protein